MVYIDTVIWILRGYNPLPANVLQSSPWHQSYLRNHHKTLHNTIDGVERNLAPVTAYSDSGGNLQTTHGLTHGPGPSTVPLPTRAGGQDVPHRDLVSADSLGLKISLLHIGDHVNEGQNSQQLASSNQSLLSTTTSGPRLSPPIDINLQSAPLSDVGESDSFADKDGRAGQEDVTITSGNSRGTKRSATDFAGDDSTLKKAGPTIPITFKVSKKSKLSELEEFPDFFFANDAEKYAQYRYSCSRDRRINDFIARSLKYHWDAGHFHDEFGTPHEARLRYWRAMNAQPDPSLTGAEYRASQYKVKLEALWGKCFSFPLPRCPNHGAHKVYDVKIRGGPLFPPPQRPVGTLAPTIENDPTQVVGPRIVVASSNSHQQLELSTGVSEQAGITEDANISLSTINRPNLSSMGGETSNMSKEPELEALRRNVAQLQAQMNSVSSNIERLNSNSEDTNERIDGIQLVTYAMAYSNQFGSGVGRFGSLGSNQLLQPPALELEPSSVSTSAQDLRSVSPQRERSDRHTPLTELDDDDFTNDALNGPKK